MLGDEDAFYAAFTSGDPTKLSPKVLGNSRSAIISQALAQTEVADVLTTEFIVENLFRANNPSGLYPLFQKAVHLVTVDRVELRTEPENFNFIFKNYADDDIYHGIYYSLPHALLFLSRVMLELFERIAPMDPGAKEASEVHSILGLYLVEGEENEALAIKRLSSLAEHFSCDCGAPLKVTPHNAARITLSESYRCTDCRRVHGFPFAWMF